MVGVIVKALRLALGTDVQGSASDDLTAKRGTCRRLDFTSPRTPM